jgi:hypothetical protein
VKSVLRKSSSRATFKFSEQNGHCSIQTVSPHAMVDNEMCKLINTMMTPHPKGQCKLDV